MKLHLQPVYGRRRARHTWWAPLFADLVPTLCLLLPASASLAATAAGAGGTVTALLQRRAKCLASVWRHHGCSSRERMTW